MTINKSISCKTLKELLSMLEKISKLKNIQMYNFNGNLNKEHGSENYSISWVEEEDF